jgi:hypothetical protein
MSKLPDLKNRFDRLVEWLDHWGVGLDEVDDWQLRDYPLEQFLVLSRSTIDRSPLAQTFQSLDEAAADIDAYEFPGDWRIIAVIDLDTGIHYRPEVRTVFCEIPVAVTADGDVVVSGFVG